MSRKAKFKTFLKRKRLELEREGYGPGDLRYILICDAEKGGLEKLQDDFWLQIEFDEFCRRKFSKRLTLFLSALLGVELCLLFCLLYVVGTGHAISGSMEPAIYTLDTDLTYLWAYDHNISIFGVPIYHKRVRDPERYDVIIFKKRSEGKVKIWGKRVIGLPGEKLEIKNGLIYINGSEIPLSDPYALCMPKVDLGPYDIPDDHYFVMGDNRFNSYDSRYWPEIYVQRNAIIGKVVAILWPNPRWI